MTKHFPAFAAVLPIQGRRRCRARSIRRAILKTSVTTAAALILCCGLVPFKGPFAGAAEPSVSDSLDAIASTDGTPAADQIASQAVKNLQDLPSDQIAEVLSGFEGANERGRNWLRALAADVSDNGTFAKQQLLDFFDDRDNDNDARYVAFQLLTQFDPELRSQLLAVAESDPSLPVRYLKIQSMLDDAKSAIESDPASGKAILRKIVANGRSPQQLRTATKLLADLGVETDLANELGMMRQWWLIGPFDNTDSEHFDTAYLPENRYLETGSPIATDESGNSISEQQKSEQGKDGEVQWQQIVSSDTLGMVDLNEPLGNEKDAAAYVFARFTAEGIATETKAQTRLGCITANKVWINGRLVDSNEVYHSGTRIDQYVADCMLTEGENTVLIKVMQNAQTQPWAQDWQFQFRLTLPDGSAIKTQFVQ